MRYHVVSLTAVFLALAVGVVLGSTSISGRLLSGLSSDREELGRQVSDLQEQRNALRAQLADSDGFALAVAPRVVRETLRDRSVVLLSTADADPADRDALAVLLAQAGAALTGEVQLTEEFTDTARSAQLGELSARLLPAGVTLPTTADSGTLAGGLLGSLLLLNPDTGRPQATPEETAAVLAGLSDGGFVRTTREIKPAQLAVVLTGGGTGDGTGDGDVGGGVGGGDRAGIVARFATQLDRAGAGAVLTGRPGSADGDGPIGVVRADTAATSLLSTVDDVSTAAGRVTTVLALAEQAQGRAGRYGTAGNAEAMAP